MRQHWTENGRRYLLFIPVIGGLQFLWLGMDILADKENSMSINTQSNTFFIGMLLAGCLHANTLFSPLNSRQRAMQYLSLPASQLEKMLCSLFYGVLIFFILYSVIFYIADIPMVQLAKNIGKGREVMTINGQYVPGGHKQVLNIFMSDPNAGYSWEQIPIFFAIQAACMLGTVYFRQYSLLKSIIAIIIVFVLFIVITSKPPGYLSPGWSSASFLTWHHYGPYGNEEFLAPPSWMIIVVETLCLSLAPVLWYITWLRLQEKEV